MRIFITCSPDIIRAIKPRRMGWRKHVERMRDVRTANKILVRKPEGTRPPARTTRRWKDTIRIDLSEIGWEIVD
jgi:hypothetical protein